MQPTKPLPAFVQLVAADDPRLADYVSPITGKPDTQLLLICNQEYKAHWTDRYIWLAIEIAQRWRPNEVTFERVSTLREWLRENDQHMHHIPLGSLSSPQQAARFCLKVVKAEYPEYDYEGEYYPDNKQARTFYNRQFKETFGE